MTFQSPARKKQNLKSSFKTPETRANTTCFSSPLLKPEVS